MPVKVSVQNLKKRYGSIEAARGVSFQIRDGEIFGLIGPNGAGKTTTVECIIGLREPDEGEIEVCGIDARRRPRAVKEKIGAALQTTAFQDKISPREALRSSARSTISRPSRMPSWSVSRCLRRPTRPSTRSRADNGSGWRWLLRSSTNPSSSSSMNLLRDSTRIRAGSFTAKLSE